MSILTMLFDVIISNFVSNGQVGHTYVRSNNASTVSYTVDLSVVQHSKLLTEYFSKFIVHFPCNKLSLNMIVFDLCNLLLNIELKLFTE